MKEYQRTMAKYDVSEDLEAIVAECSREARNMEVLTK